MPNEHSPLLHASDKDFWHGYIDFYERSLPGDVGGVIVEFGVFRGQSVRWLLERYPAAQIVGVDILPVSDEWPTSSRVVYHQLDQDSETQVAAFFDSIPEPELIIEDGSHIPAHQSRCLRQGLAHLQPGGTYVLEDIHTSHPAHPYFRQEFERRGSVPPQTALSVLLALEHRRRVGDLELDDETANRLAQGDHFDLGAIRALDDAIESVEFFKRCTLPRACYNCGATSFDYHTYRCTCGVELMDVADSMSAIIRKRSGAVEAPGSNSSALE